jgi:hypothetical protein
MGVAGKVLAFAVLFDHPYRCWAMDYNKVLIINELLRRKDSDPWHVAAYRLQSNSPVKADS